MTGAPRRIEHDGVRPWRWRVLIAVPPAGFGGQLATMRAAGLDQSCGPEGWDRAPAGIVGIVNDAIAFYFTSADDARAFIGRFSCGYRTAPPHGS